MRKSDPSAAVPDAALPSTIHGLVPPASMQSDDGLLFAVGALIDFLHPLVQLGIADAGFADLGLPTDPLIQADGEDVGDLHQHLQAGRRPPRCQRL